jgi:hypothetical protein
MAAPSVTHTFSNGTTADATQVNTNFNDVINALTDGNSDLTFSALTAQGATALNGTVALGNATGDTITFTGYVAGSIIPSSNAAVVLGSSSLSFSGLYLDNDSTDGGAIFFDAGTTEFIKANAAGTDLALGGFTDFDLAGARIKEMGLSHSAKTADYTVTDTDGVSVVLMTTSTTDRTVTLPTASANDGRVITVKKVDSASGSLTLDGEGSETIDGELSTAVASIGGFITVICDGTGWHLLACQDSGVYTPTCASVLDFTSVSGDVSTYMRSLWNVSVGLRVTATSVDTTQHRLDFTVPIDPASNFGSANDLIGTGMWPGSTYTVGTIFADTSSKKGRFYVFPSGAGASSVYATFQYTLK